MVDSTAKFKMEIKNWCCLRNIKSWHSKIPEKRLNKRTEWNMVGGVTAKLKNQERKQHIWSGMQCSECNAIFDYNYDFLNVLFLFYSTSGLSQSPRSETWGVRLDQPKTRVKGLHLEGLCLGSLCERAARVNLPQEGGQVRSWAQPQRRQCPHWPGDSPAASGCVRQSCQQSQMQQTMRKIWDPSWWSWWEQQEKRPETGLKIWIQHRSKVHPEDRVRERTRDRCTSDIDQAWPEMDILCPSWLEVPGESGHGK